MDRKQLKGFLEKHKAAPAVLKLVKRGSLYNVLLRRHPDLVGDGRSVSEAFRDALHKMTMFTDEGPMFDPLGDENDEIVITYLYATVLEGGPDDKHAAKALAQWPEDSEELRELFKRSFKKEQEMNDD